MLRLLGEVPPDDYVAPVELIERASLQAPAARPARLAAEPACGAAHGPPVAFCRPVNSGWPQRVNSVTALDTPAAGASAYRQN